MIALLRLQIDKSLLFLFFHRLFVGARGHVGVTFEGVVKSRHSIETHIEGDVGDFFLGPFGIRQNLFGLVNAVGIDKLGEIAV